MAAHEIDPKNLVHVPGRAVLDVSGPDAGKLLGDILTSSLPEKGEAKWFGLLTPQGKIIAEGQILSPTPDQFFLTVDAEVAEEFFKKIRLYKLRAQCEVSLRSDLIVGWANSNKTDSFENLNAVAAGIDERSPELGIWLVLNSDTQSELQGDVSQFHEKRLQLGFAMQGHEFGSQEVFPHDIGMDQTQSIDFKKGCYIGQEVVSRMQHRGTARTRPVLVSSDNSDWPLGDISVAGKNVGETKFSQKNMAIGLLRIDRISIGAEANIGGQKVQLALPPWARYDFADSSE